MRSDPTGPRGTPLDRTSGAGFGAARRGLLALTVLLVFAGCSTGRVNESRLDQARDAEQTPQMPVQQATRIAQRYFPASPPASPTVPLAPVVGFLAITLATNPDGSPQGSYASVPVDAGQVLAAARLHDATAGQLITAVWTDGFGNEAGRVEQELAAGGPVQWITLPLGLSPSLSPGPYGVYIFADERQIASLGFNLTSPGSAPQIYPELPANPQAPAAQPTSPSGAPTVAPREGNQEGQGG